MPFIRGRYHINPIAGEALEAAREAEAALVALEQAAQAGNDGDGERDGDGAEQAKSSRATAKGPVHHIEIEAAGMVPAHSGRATHGFVARVHRTVVAHATPNFDDPADGFADSPTSTWSSRGGTSVPGLDFSRGGTGRGPKGSETTPAETHVFSDHRDLVAFLRDLLTNDCGR